MKILIVHELFMPDFSGGGEKLVYELAKGLKNNNIEVKVVTTGNPKIKEYEGIETVRLPINRYLMNFAGPFILKYARDCDIVQACNYNAALPGWFAGKLMKKPTLCWALGFYSDQWKQMRGPVFGTFSKYIENIQTNRNFDKILFPSPYSQMIGLKAGIPENRTEVVYPGVDTGKFNKLPKEKFVLFSGRLAKQKGVYHLIKVAKKLPDIKFILMGKGEEEKKIRSIAPKNVEFKDLSLKSGKPYFDMYGKAPVFFLPSVAEAFGIVLVEAMSAGCAIVSTVPLGYKGFTTKVGDTNGMAKAIRYLFDNLSKAEKMGMENIKLSKQFTWGNFTKRMINIYKDVLNEKL